MSGAKLTHYQPTGMRPFKAIAHSSEQPVALSFDISESKLVEFLMRPAEGRARRIPQPMHLSTIVIVVSLLLALTGFVCTYKIQAEEECQTSNIFCYECDSRYHPNCGDPFELPSLSLPEQQLQLQQQQQQQQSRLSAQPHDDSVSASTNSMAPVAMDNRLQPDNTNNSLKMRPIKQYPNASICRGCCVKITSKTREGAVYIRRTCTEKLQINYFMVDLVCMKESGSRGNMCFCETDYCNGSDETNRVNMTLLSLLLLGLTIISIRLVSTPPISTFKPVCQS